MYSRHLYSAEHMQLHGTFDSPPKRPSSLHYFPPKKELTLHNFPHPQTFFLKKNWNKWSFESITWQKKKWEIKCGKTPLNMEKIPTTVAFKPSSATRIIFENEGAHVSCGASHSPAPQQKDWRKGCNVHEWSSVSFQPIVVPGPVEKSFHFLHVRLPVNLCV